MVETSSISILHQFSPELAGWLCEAGAIRAAGSLGLGPFSVAPERLDSGASALPSGLRPGPGRWQPLGSFAEPAPTVYSLPSRTRFSRSFWPPDLP